MEPLSLLEVWAQIILRFWPVWLALLLITIPSRIYRDQLGIYGRIYYSGAGLIGLVLVLFWVLTAIFAPLIAPFDPIVQNSDFVNFIPQKQLGAGHVNAGTGQAYLMGTDNTERDIFSRLVYGSRMVLILAPAATAIAFIVGITLGVAAGYLSGAYDAVLSFLANLILAFPVILLFYLFVTPGIDETGITQIMAGVLFLFPIIFFGLLLWSRYNTRPTLLLVSLGVVLLVWGWLYAGIVFSVGSWIGDSLAEVLWLDSSALVGLALLMGLAFVLLWAWGQSSAGQPQRLLSLGLVSVALGVLVILLPQFLKLFDLVIPVERAFLGMDSSMLNIFVAVVFVSSPGVFRIVRGLVMDIKTRDYVAAAETRGEGPWYIMLWEILPNVRGPLIVDACLRIGYTTILLGTLGVLGIGIDPESPDWGSMIAQIRKFMQTPDKAFHIFPPAMALLTLVLGLNLLADGIREQSLKD